MTTFVYGVSAEMRARHIEQCILRDVEQGRRVYLIVPEQQTYLTEHRYARLLPPAAQLSFEAVNFSRLANIARRRWGGLCYNHIDRSTRSLIMWRTLRELGPTLSEYGQAASSPSRLSSLTELMLSTVDELRSAAVTPATLEAAAHKLPRDSSLRRRLEDISLIWLSYTNLTEDSYDDPADDLTALAEMLQQHDLFGDRCVYIDSFTSYTHREYDVIALIMRQAIELTVTVGSEGPNSRRIHFASLDHASQRLRDLASTRGGFRDVLIRQDDHAVSSELALLEQQLWQTPKQPPSPYATPDSISLVCASTPYSEAEAAASCICEALRQGMRCRDIAVIMRDATAWQGVVDAVFDKFGIPYFFSEHTQLTSKPLFKLLTSVLNIKNRNWRQNDVISLLKTGLCGIDERDCDIFEDYCSTWNITGVRFLDDVWSMNPDGYADTLSDRAENILRRANEVRSALVAPLLKLFTELEAADSVAEQCRALYLYTEEIGVRTALDALARREAEAGDPRAAEECLRLYKVYVDALDKVSAVLADDEPDTLTLEGALKMIFENTAIGSLPTRHDEVTIGSASLLRTDAPRLVIVMGACEGEFPAELHDSGTFSYADRARLNALGIDLSSDPGLDSADELFFAYRALTCASDQLMVTYSEAGCDGSRRKPSRIIDELTAIFPKLKPLPYAEASPLARIQTPENALEYLLSLGDSPEGVLLRASLAQNKEIAAHLSLLDTPVADAGCQVSTETGKLLFGDNMTLSQSRLESFVQCPFRYYCDYVLGLRDSSRADFSYSSVGVFIHYVMENFMRTAVSENGFAPDLNDEDAAHLADSIIDEYARRLIPSDDERHSRMTFLISKLRRIALVLIYNIMEEFQHSLFRPSFFELNMDGSDPVLSGAQFGVGDGETVRLRGVVDRVDLFRKDGDVYIRVIDYKTGKKEYSPEDVADGIGLQLLLYLFALCNTKDEKFRRAVGCDRDGKIYPAGALYLSANLPVISVDEAISPEKIRRLAVEQIKRSGPLLDDDDVLHAMNDTLDPDFLGTAKGSSSGGNMLSGADFATLCSEIEGTLGSIRAQMRSGNASASPRKKKGASPCDYCSYKSVCRSASPSKRYKK